MGAGEVGAPSRKLLSVLLGELKVHRIPLFCEKCLLVRKVVRKSFPGAVNKIKSPWTWLEDSATKWG